MRVNRPTFVRPPISKTYCMYAPLRRHAYVADRCHVTRATPHHRTLSAPDIQRCYDSCNIVRNGSSLFLLLSAQSREATDRELLASRPRCGQSRWPCLSMAVCGASAACPAFPPPHALMTTNDGAMMAVKLLNSNARQTPGGCFRSMSAPSPLSSQNSCAPRLHCALKENVRIGTPRRAERQYRTMYSAGVPYMHSVFMRAHRT
jgi:hypothetical protein